MIDNETCEIIIDRFYNDVYNFCLSRLGNIHSAEECTQEVFLILFQKRGKLDFSEKFRSWLYSTADKVCKNYIKKNHINTADIDDYAESIPDNSTDGRPLSEELYDILDKENADLLLEYIESDYGERKNIAKRLGITVKALYGRMDRIRKKVIDYIVNNK